MLLQVLSSLNPLRVQEVSGHLEQLAIDLVDLHTNVIAKFWGNFPAGMTPPSVKAAGNNSSMGHPIRSSYFCEIVGTGRPAVVQIFSTYNKADCLMSALDPPMPGHTRTK